MSTVQPIGAGDPAWGTTIKTVSGRHVDLIAMDWRTVSLADIAYALAHLPRWGGHRIRQISVLEHSLDVWKHAHESFKLEALLHDAHEAYLGDITRPVRRALAFHCAGVRQTLEAIEGAIDVAIIRAVFEAAGAPARDQVFEAEIVAAAMRSSVVRLADDESLGREAADPYGPLLREAIPHLVAQWTELVLQECRVRFAKVAV